MIKFCVYSRQQFHDDYVLKGELNAAQEAINLMTKSGDKSKF